MDNKKVVKTRNKEKKTEAPFPCILQTTVNMSEVRTRVYFRGSDPPLVVVWPLCCQNQGVRYSTECHLCANTPPLVFPLGNLWFWSIYLQEKSCTIIPCVFLLCAQNPVFWLCVLHPFLLPTRKSLVQTCTRLFVCAILSFVSRRSRLACECVGELE